MANKEAALLLLLTVVLKTTNTLGTLVEGKAEPVQYISLPPGTYDEGSYLVIHNTSNCRSSIEEVDGSDETVITCAYGELLLDGITQTNLNDGLTNSDIQTFYTWEDHSLPMGINDAFVTLQFPNNAITPTRVDVYYLEMMELRATEPQRIRLYSSSTESIFPDDEIRANDDIVVTNSGTTPGNDDYEYRKCSLTIPEDRQVSLNYLRISLEFDPMVDWIFISEVEVYHMYELPNTTSVQMPTPSTVITPSNSVMIPSNSNLISTMTTYLSSSTAVMTTEARPTTRSTLSIAHSSVISSAHTNVLPTPVFVFPTVNPLMLLLKTTFLNLIINCTVRWEGDSQLNTMWSYNGTMITNSTKYTVAKMHLTIREFAPEDAGTYECTVQDPSGRWTGSRQYVISIKDENNIQQPGKQPDTSSEDLPLPIIIGAGVGCMGILFCFALICVIICYRKNKRGRSKKRNNSYLVTEKSESPLDVHTYVNHIPCEQRKHSIDSRYEKVNITDSLTAETSTESKLSPPTVPRFPKKFKYSKKIPPPELPKLRGDYAFLGNYKKLPMPSSPLVSDQGSETYFDIYDDPGRIRSAVKSIPQSPQDIYCEAFDYNHCNEKDDDSALSMCVSIYDNPGPLKETEAPEFVDWSNVRVVAKIGEGQFGDVYLAETSGINAAKMRNTESKLLAAIKTLKGDYSLYMKQQFEKEIKFMSRLNNANVVRLLGICNKGTPFIMMEYMSNGDLNMFLKQHYLEETGKDTAKAIIPVDNVLLQYIALQIANGMRYLASFGFIHRDLAARNCLVGEDYLVKIADFGMTQDLYNESYFVMRGKAIVPIRWMAPECFFGKFSTKTDVWSYGITLWEIFTLCREQPYYQMTDEMLLIDVQKGRNRTLLKRPPSVPDEVYYIMTTCWLYDSKNRPDFESIYDQLYDFYMRYIQQ